MTFIERIVELDGTIIEKPYSEAQLEEAEFGKIEAEKLAIKQVAAAAAKAALLEKLGITEDEAKLLLS
jgi:hypothetical protein